MKKIWRKLGLFAALLLGGCATGGLFDADAKILRHEYGHCNGWMHAEGAGPAPPPAMYDHTPTMPVHVIHVAWRDLPRYCSGHDAALACTMLPVTPQGCTIYTGGA